MKIPCLKIFGLALAMLAIATMGTSAALGDELTAEKEKVALVGTDEPGIPNYFTITDGVTTCKEVTYVVDTITTPTTTVTAKPTYPEHTKSGERNCISLGYPAVIHASGCHYLFHVNEGSSTQGDVTLSCLPGYELTVTSVAGGVAKCTIHVPPQTDESVITYQNISAGSTREVKLSINAPHLDYSHTGGTGLGKCIGGSGSSGTFLGMGRVTATEDGGSAHVGLFLSSL
jgi:hypothetical protein